MRELINSGLPFQISSKDGVTIMIGNYVIEPSEVVKIANEYRSILNRCSLCGHARSDHYVFEQPTYCCDGCDGFIQPPSFDDLHTNLATAQAEVERLTAENEKLRTDSEVSELNFSEVVDSKLRLLNEVERLTAVLRDIRDSDETNAIRLQNKAGVALGKADEEQNEN